MPKNDSLDDLIAIFCFDKKSDLKKHCRSVTIHQRDLAGLIYTSASGTIPLLHQAHHREFIPEHLTLEDSDLAALVTNGVGPMNPPAQRTANKIGAIFDERRLLSGHMFYTPDLSQWHLFYFDQRDFDERGNHWEGGSHIHLVNYLWPNRTADKTWQDFCTGNPQMRGALHIRFKRVRREPFVGPAGSEFVSNGTVNDFGGFTE